MAVMGWVHVKGEGDRLVSGVQGVEKLVQAGALGQGWDAGQAGNS